MLFFVFVFYVFLVLPAMNGDQMLMMRILKWLDNVHLRFYLLILCFFFCFIFSRCSRSADISRFSPRTEQKIPVTFTGGKQEFLCEIGLFRRLPGTALFSQRIGPGSAVELGEEVQLRSIVRSNDGMIFN